MIDHAAIVNHPIWMLFAAHPAPAETVILAPMPTTAVSVSAAVALVLTPLEPWKVAATAAESLATIGHLMIEIWASPDVEL
jgi:hypothetical protein